ncbi:hypothetical protein [Rhizobium sp. CECT 9324]|uniref:hypothetical protein n=1 Tax=Rhizobium sp. CECT 9324 TaxID=2845820 RepID=UPI001E4692B9|nr:hypothetical protein [Rhizobium sp. CECT 9324]CAH0343310.1 hypothetical protein RHI9324_05043 [Rhizobium sp. CECT 9324]
MQTTHKQIRDIARTNTTPLQLPRSTREVPIMAGTSVPAGKMTPVTAFPLLREDALKTSTIYCKVDLMEAVEAVRNPIRVRFMAYFVPFLAFSKFDGGRDEFDRSYMKTAGANGQPVTPFFETVNAGAVGSIPIHKYLGLHAPANANVNDAYIRAYNLIWNFRARNRSQTLFNAKKRLETATSLAPAFWNHEQFKYIVPDWDDVAMEGAVDLTFTTGNIPLRGTLAQRYVPVAGDGATTLQVSGTNGLSNRSLITASTTGVDYAGARLGADINNLQGLRADLQNAYADLGSAGIKFSLANIELAKKAQWYADAKARFEGLVQGELPDNVTIDLLMQGINVPDKMWQQPILVADKTEVANLDKRWATDGANLSSAVVNGEAMTVMNLVMPRCPTGGIMMVVAEILPDQIFERMQDPLLFTTDVATLPRADRDDQDPQKVQRISSGALDTSHTAFNGLFGYAPLNWPWQASYTRLGGKYFRSAPSATFNQDRAQFWTVEQVDVQYNADFMISENMNQLPFQLLNADVGEAQIMGSAIIEGNTIFGERLLENDNAYAEVLANVDQSRIIKGV